VRIRAIAVGAACLLLVGCGKRQEPRTLTVLCGGSFRPPMVKIGKEGDIFVTHHLDEMQSVADRVGILDGGRLVQTDTPEQMRRHPATAEVARSLALGTIVPGAAAPGEHGRRIDLGDFCVPADGELDGPVNVLIRPGGLRLTPAWQCENGLPARLRSVLWRDVTVRVDVEISATGGRAEMPRARAESLGLQAGSEVWIAVPPEAVHVLPDDASENH